MLWVLWVTRLDCSGHSTTFGSGEFWLHLKTLSSLSQSFDSSWAVFVVCHYALICWETQCHGRVFMCHGVGVCLVFRGGWGRWFGSSGIRMIAKVKGFSAEHWTVAALVISIFSWLPALLTYPFLLCSTYIHSLSPQVSLLTGRGDDRKDE